MSKECKNARTTVGIALLVLLTLLLTLQSCGATASGGNTWGAAASCPAYR